MFPPSTLPPDLAAALDAATELVRQTAFFATVVRQQSDALTSGLIYFPDELAALARDSLLALDAAHDTARGAVAKVALDLVAVRQGTAQFGPITGATAHEAALMLGREVDARLPVAVVRVCSDPKDWPGIMEDTKRLFSPDTFRLWAPHFDTSGLNDADDAGALLADLRFEAGRAAALRQTAPPLPRPRNGTINQCMLEELQRNPLSAGWSQREWAEHLRCSPSTVAEAGAWRTVQLVRVEEQAARLQRRRKRAD
jgi:hypothetical protein